MVFYDSDSRIAFHVITLQTQRFICLMRCCCSLSRWCQMPLMEWGRREGKREWENRGRKSFHGASVWCIMKQRRLWHAHCLPQAIYQWQWQCHTYLISPTPLPPSLLHIDATTCISAWISNGKRPQMSTLGVCSLFFAGIYIYIIIAW